MSYLQVFLFFGKVIVSLFFKLSFLLLCVCAHVCVCVCVYAHASMYLAYLFENVVQLVNISSMLSQGITSLKSISLPL